MAGERPAIRAGGLAAAGAVIVLALAAAPAARAAGEMLQTCLACHGADGTSTTAGVPSLGGQPEDFVLMQLYLFREGQRGGEVMPAMARPLTDDDLRALSAAIAKLPPPRPQTSDNAALAGRGAEVASANRCGICHQPDLSGREQVPRIAGQREDYLLRSLKEYKAGRGSGPAVLMQEALQAVAEADLPALAHYLSTLR